MGRFELLQLMYQRKKSNEELTLRCRELEKQLDTLKRDTSQREDKLRRDYEQRIDEIRMQGSAKDLQQRMKKIEQLLSMQQIPDQQPVGADLLKEDVPAPEASAPRKDGE